MVGCALAALLLAAGCDPDTGPTEGRIVREHGPRIQEIVREDVERGQAGVDRAAERMAAGFLLEDADQQRREMRVALNLLRDPRRGIPEITLSPIAFVAAVLPSGVVIARDGEEADDRLAGFDAGATGPLVQQALSEGRGAHALVEVPSSTEDGPTSETMLFVAPARRGGRVVGAIIAGTPLYRTSQRLWRQLHTEAGEDFARGLVLWVYMYRGDRLHMHGTPEDLTEALPDAAARSAGLAAHPHGYTGNFALFGRWYAYGVLPLPRLGPDVGAIIVRSEVP